uniref:Uncharacterized protein n=1 Tax=Rhizophora mucronata TaxID=61149 RepID=A0A2P2IR44_RHIMU
MCSGAHKIKCYKSPTNSAEKVRKCGFDERKYTDQEGHQKTIQM